MNKYRQNCYWMWRFYITIKLVHLLIFDTEIVIRGKNFHGIGIEKRNLYSLYIKVVYEISDKISSAVNVASIWKSKLYIYADGQ
jgi:hypothetical protein